MITYTFNISMRRDQFHDRSKLEKSNIKTKRDKTVRIQVDGMTSSKLETTTTTKDHVHRQRQHLRTRKPFISMFFCLKEWANGILVIERLRRQSGSIGCTVKCHDLMTHTCRVIHNNPITRIKSTAIHLLFDSIGI